MERRRKGYLLRKTDYIDPFTYLPPVNGNAVCNCNKSPARSYDLQSQTITFGTEDEPSLVTHIGSYSPNNFEISQNVPELVCNCNPMDQDLEFYPVDDHPSPSTFTAWDAFLAGNQAFFREPPGLLPDPAFSYMDVIPEEDDLEALLESDTDDTGSSVSTVIDRFSRTSTANSSFSERCKGTADVTFDLQKVLSPFERLEKELDESKEETLTRKEVPRGPIVVITNSSSCEDVHSAEEEETSNAIDNSNSKKTEEAQVESHETNEVVDAALSIETSEVSVIHESKASESNKQVTELEISNTEQEPVVKPEVNKIPQVPARTKLANGSKISEKSRSKSDKSENTSPSSSPQKKKSYPTPSVPPRMSKHVTARRTRSDPGAPDQPSRIPRPISSANRSPTNNATPKSTSRNNKSSPKINTKKKLKPSESPKTNRIVNKPTPVSSESSVPEAKIEVTSSKNGKIKETLAFEDNFVVEVATETNDPEPVIKVETTENEAAYEANNLIETFETTPSDSATVIVVTDTNSQGCDTISDQTKSDTDPEPSASDGQSSNPFKKNENNPFNSAEELRIPFATGSNPFAESPEVTPSCQMSASLIAPPIPERPSLKAAKRKENSATEKKEVASEFLESTSASTVVEAESIVDVSETLEDVTVNSQDDVTVNSQDDVSAEISLSPEKTPIASIHEAIEAALQEMNMSEIIMTEDVVSQNNLEKDNTDPELADIGSGLQQQRPIEDILQALDQLVLSAPREVEISIDWGVRGPVNIREKTVLPSDASGDRSDIVETDGLPEERRRDIETLLKEVDECLKVNKGGEDLSPQQSTRQDTLPASDSALSSASEKSPLSPGSLDAPTAGSTTLNLSQHEEQASLESDILSEQQPLAMLKHQSQNILAGEQRVNYSVPYQEVYSKSTEHLDEVTIVHKHHSSGCDDSGVFLEDSVASSPETQSRSAVTRLQNSLDKLSNDSLKMRQYSIHEGLDSDAEKSDDLGLASSSIDSADDLDGDPLPSTLQITSCPPAVTSRQKPPPVPARKSTSKSSEYQKNNRYFSEMTTIDVPNHPKAPLSKSSSSGEDSNFGEGDHYMTENSSSFFSLNEKSKNLLNHQKNEQSRNNFAMTKSFHEDMLMNQQRDINQDSKANFLARTLSTSDKKVDLTNGKQPYNRRHSEQPSGFKWKSEECLRTAAENKWSIPGRRYEKAVSVKDRIAMFSEMEANQNTSKRDDLQRYGSENNIKAITGITENKKMELPLNESSKAANLLKDSKWHSMQSIAKKPLEKETTYVNTNMKPAVSIPSLTSNNLIDNVSNYCTLPMKLDVEPPKPIVSTYPETQLTNNKRYNYGLYSLKNLKNTENLLSKKAAGSNLLSIIDNRKQSTQKLKGLVIPDKPYQFNGSKELPTIVSSDSDSMKEPIRTPLPITAVTAAKAMSLPRNKKLECVPAQRQTSLSEPPWKNESSTSYTLPKYSPAFKKRSLELPGSSLSPTPPSSITSPMSPPPSSPSSICSSNASSTLQQNVFQFSLSHSKPVQPLQPEKALMSPPSLPSDVEYEGDNSEDSSHSVSPMRGLLRSNKEVKASTQYQHPGAIFEKSNAFCSSVKTIPHQPMMVEILAKSPLPSETEPPKPKAAIYLSKTEILLKKDDPKPEFLSQNQELISGVNNSKSNDQMTHTEDASVYKTNGVRKDDAYSQMKISVHEMQIKNGDVQYTSDYYSNKTPSENDVRNGGYLTSQTYTSSETIEQDVPVGKFRAFPVSLKESEAKSAMLNNGQNLESKQKKNIDSSWGNGRPPHSECDESEDDDSHSTLSHRTEDSRHTTTDDCLSDATTDSFEKPRLITESRNIQRSNDDNASTEGYLSDASTTDVSLRRFTNRPLDCNAYSTEEYLSDVTAESPDPDWVSSRATMDQHVYPRTRIYGRNENINHGRYEDGSENADKNADLDLRPRRLSQQRTVLKAAVEPSGSVQKFKALAEKWEQRTDVISPPPPVTAPLPSKRESKTNSIATGIVSSTCVSSTVIKGKSSLPPSLMPRNSSEKKSQSSSRSSSKENVYTTVRTTVDKETSSSAEGIVTRQSISSTSTVIESVNGWNPHPYGELNRLESRRDSTSSGSSSSKTTLKDDEVFSSPLPLQPEVNGFDSAKFDAATAPVTAVTEDIIDAGGQRPGQMSLPPRQEDIFNNEPRNRRGADFSRSNPMPEWPKSNRAVFGAKSTFSVSDIRRSFENGAKEPEKPALPPKKASMPVARSAAPAVVQAPLLPSRKPSLPSEDGIECDDDLRKFAESARKQLNHEGVGSKSEVLTIVLRREGEGGGSVGITLAGGADYEVKEITVHKVISGSIADRDGRVMKGDRVMSINGRDLRGVSHGEALHILKAPSPTVVLVLARDKCGVPLQQNGTTDCQSKKRHDYGSSKDSEIVVVHLMKDITGVGFSIEGGRDSPQGDRPLLIKRIFKGGAADKAGKLEEGDEILSINDQPVINMTRTEAWNFLKKLPEGPILLRARKSPVIA